jgi:plastocyanin
MTITQVSAGTVVTWVNNAAYFTPITDIDSDLIQPGAN